MLWWTHPTQQAAASMLACRLGFKPCEKMSLRCGVKSSRGRLLVVDSHEAIPLRFRQPWCACLHSKTAWRPQLGSSTCAARAGRACAEISCSSIGTLPALMHPMGCALKARLLPPITATSTPMLMLRRVEVAQTVPRQQSMAAAAMQTIPRRQSSGLPAALLRVMAVETITTDAVFEPEPSRDRVRCIRQQQILLT